MICIAFASAVFCSLFELWYWIYDQKYIFENWQNLMAPPFISLLFLNVIFPMNSTLLSCKEMAVPLFEIKLLLIIIIPLVDTKSRIPLLGDLASLIAFCVKLWGLSIPPQVLLTMQEPRLFYSTVKVVLCSICMQLEIYQKRAFPPN